jgi:hypothetical protein
VIEAYSSITASVVNGILTVSANATMPVCPGMVLFTAAGAVSSGTVAGTVVLNQLTGASGIIGHVGTWNTSATNLNVASGTVTLGFPNVQSCIVPQGGLGVPPSIAMWNPQALTSRVLQVTAAAGATATTATISGYDIYGYPMVEAITIVAGGTAQGKKAWKYVRSVVLNAADATHAYSVDTLDVYGLPLRADSFGETLINYASASATAAPLVTAVAGFTPSDRTPATSTTGDVRGTYALQSAATTNTSLLQIRQNLVPANVATAFGMFGTTQFANF